MKKNVIMALCGAAMMLIPAVACQRNSDNKADDSAADTAVVADMESSEAATDSVANLFKENVGKYPREVNLIANTDMKARLVALLGQERYDFLAANFNTETPIEDKDGVYTAEAGKAHDVAATNFTIAYDSKTNLLSVVYRVDGKDETFSEK